MLSQPEKTLVILLRTVALNEGSWKRRVEEVTLGKWYEESSSPGEFHPQALTDPDVNVSAHPALIIPLLPFITTLPYLLVPPITG